MKEVRTWRKNDGKGVFFPLGRMANRSGVSLFFRGKKIGTHISKTIRSLGDQSIYDWKKKEISREEERNLEIREGKSKSEKPKLTAGGSCKSRGENQTAITNQISRPRSRERERGEVIVDPKSAFSLAAMKRNKLSTCVFCFCFSAASLNQVFLAGRAFKTSVYS